jgi:hypothetical protein
MKAHREIVASHRIRDASIVSVQVVKCRSNNMKTDIIYYGSGNNMTGINV